MLPDSIKEYIVRNSIIDNGSSEAYKSSDFNVEGALSNTNMNELVNNNLRRPTAETHIGLPVGYCENLSISNETYLAYNSEYAPLGWRNYLGDEIMAYGQYDFVYKLPAVPVTGTYELRMASSNNPYRGMAQIYLGTNKDNLTAVGLPVDLRLRGVDPMVGWEADTEEQLYNLSVDKAMRNHNYMKALCFTGLTSGKRGGEESACH